LRYRRQRATGTGEGDASETSAALLTLAAVAIGAFSTAVIIAQWVAVMVFDPCMQS
jgi:hypothetical protein